MSLEFNLSKVSESSNFSNENLRNKQKENEYERLVINKIFLGKIKRIISVLKITSLINRFLFFVDIVNLYNVINNILPKDSFTVFRNDSYEFSLSKNLLKLNDYEFKLIKYFVENCKNGVHFISSYCLFKGTYYSILSNDFRCFDENIYEKNSEAK